MSEYSDNYFRKQVMFDGLWKKIAPKMVLILAAGLISTPILFLGTDYLKEHKNLSKAKQEKKAAIELKYNLDKKLLSKAVEMAENTENSVKSKINLAQSLGWYDDSCISNYTSDKFSKFSFNFDSERNLIIKGTRMIRENNWENYSYPIPKENVIKRLKDYIIRQTKNKNIRKQQYRGEN